MIGENIAKLRRRKGFSQKEVADRIGVSRQTIAKWENEESIPDVVRCNALAELFCVSLDDLVNYKETRVVLENKMPQGKYMFGAVTVGDRGQIVIPVRARRVFDIKPGDDLIMLGDEEQGLQLISAAFFFECFGKMQEVQKGKNTQTVQTTKKEEND